MREVFEKALTEDVYDELTHRAYADWLYENGHDQEAEYHVLWTKEWQEAKDELEKIVHQLDGPYSGWLTVDDLIAEYERYLECLATDPATINFTPINFSLVRLDVLEQVNKYYLTYTRHLGKPKEEPQAPEPEEPVQPYTCCCVEDSEDQCCY